MGSSGRRILDFGPCSLLGQDPAVWTRPPALQIFLSPFQGSAYPFLLYCGVDSLCPSLCLSFLLLEPWRLAPPSPPTLPGP